MSEGMRAAPGGDLSYRLVVLTHGDSAPLAETLAAYGEHVRPAPAETVLVYDGEEPPGPVEDFIRDCYGGWSLTNGPLGFCGATRHAWAVAAEPGVQYSFYLEHDFVVARPVDLWHLVQVLERHPNLAQVTLMRDAYSREEHQAGGLFAYRQADYRPVTHLDGTSWWLRMPWFTTNPSLMRRDFMAENPWPADGHKHCEGRFGGALREKGYEFGTWGDGSVYARHIGVRTGFGY